MALVQFDPSLKDDFPYLTEGQWGPGCDVEASCTITSYEFPTSDNPGYDKDGTEGPYALFNVRCVRDGEPNVNVKWHVKTGQAWRTVAKLGIDIADDGAHDTSEVDGLEVIVVAGAPRANKNNPDQFYSTVKTILPV